MLNSSQMSNADDTDCPTWIEGYENLAMDSLKRSHLSFGGRKTEW